MRRFALAAVLAFAAGAAAPAGSADAPRQQLNAAFEQACPAKHFEYLGDYDLSGLVEAWENTLPHNEHERFFDLKMKLHPQCAAAATGLRCEEAIDVQAIQGAGLQQSLVSYACASELACTGDADCRGSVIH